MSKTDIRRMVAAAAVVCEEKKAEEIRILELDPADSGFTDFFLICSGSNDRQNQTIATAVEERMQRDFGTRPNSMEGYRQGEWILLDYVDFVVHIFSREKRAYYDIERLRKSATPVDLEQLKAVLTQRVSTVRKKQSQWQTSAVAKPAAQKASAKKASVKKSRVKKPVTVKKKAAPKKSAKAATPKKQTRTPSKND